jgi:hypothetical protein
MSSSSNVNGLLASIKKLNGTNYYDWKFDISMVMRRAGTWKVVSGVTKKPTKKDTDELKEWEELAEDGLTAIGLTIEQSQKQYIRDCEDGPAAWKKLAEIYEKNSTATRISLKRKFYSYHHDTERPISDYINDITTLASQLKAIGVTLKDEDITDVLIYSLAPEYSAIATVLMAQSNASTTVADITSALIEEEARRKELEGPEIITETGLAAKHSTVECGNCHKRGHTIEKCWAKGGKGKKVCHQCKKEGHLSWECPDKKNQEETHISSIAYDLPDEIAY